MPFKIFCFFCVYLDESKQIQRQNGRGGPCGETDPRPRLRQEYVQAGYAQQESRNFRCSGTIKRAPAPAQEVLWPERLC
jgi:hypothetical protein